MGREKLTGRPHSRLDAAVCEEARERDGLDALALELLLQVGAREGGEALLALHHDIAIVWTHGLTEVCVPGALREQLVASASS